MDLLETAAKLLVMGGRMCYWMPDFVDYEPANDGAQSTTAAGRGQACSDDASVSDDVGKVTEARCHSRV